MFILASSSPYRRELFARLGLPFTHASPDIDETPLPDESAEQLVQRLAQAKAEKISQDNPAAWCIGSDQVCLLNGTITGKPHTEAKAKAQLQAASGQAIEFLTGLSLVNKELGVVETRLERFWVHFRDLSDAQITAYIKKEQPLDCAGSFKSEGLGIALFDRLEGRDPNGLIGLPLILLCDMLAQQGLDPLTWQD